jgi:membrane protein YdbS with pleckstrin-like domain
MKCPICTKDTADGAAFCQHCGAKLPSGAEKVAIATAPRSAAVDPPSAARSGKYNDVPEETLWEGTYSPKAMLAAFVLCGILSIALVVGAVLFFSATPVLGAVMLGAIVVIWLAALAKLAVNRLGRSYRLTNQMFYHREGVFTRTTDRVELIEIHDVAWTQGIIERTVGVGTITITSADRSHGILNLKGIENAEDVAGKIDKARRAEQVRRGRRIDFSSIDHQT